MRYGLPDLIASSWLDRVLGLEEPFSLSAQNTALGWDHPLPAWLWLLIVAGALGLSAFSYQRMLGPGWVRVVLAALRGTLLIAVALLLAGPTVVRTEVTPEPDWLLVLVDRSASLGFEDMPLGGDGDEVVTRDAALRAALARQADVFSEARLGQGRNIVWLGFDRDAYPIQPPPEIAAGLAPPADGEIEGMWAPAQLETLLPPAQARATNLRTAVDQALQLAAGRAVSGVVLITDAQSPQTTGQAFVDKLARLETPVFAVPLGSEQARLDLSIDRVDLPATAFVGDLIPVAVTVRRLDLAPGVVDGEEIDPDEIVLRLLDDDTGELLDTRTLAGVGLGEPARLQTLRDSEGEINLRVEVQHVVDPESARSSMAELSLRNNTRVARVEVIDRALKVLYIEGTARWEYRFLVSMLMREASIDSSILLLDSDREFVQEGDTRIRRFPQTREDLQPYDLIVIGDVQQRFFSEDQLALVRDHVAVHGAGLLWIGGPRYTPNDYTGSALELLLPMARPGSVGRLIPPQGREIPAQPTEAAQRLNLLQLSRRPGHPAEVSDDHWPTNLPAFRWAQDLGRLRPGATPLAHAAGLVDPQTGDEAPLVVLYRYGAGEILYVGTDETWRWRKAGGEVYFEQFWIQLIRKLGRARVQQADRRVRFSVLAPTVDLGSTQLVELVIDDPALIRLAPPSLAVALHQAPATDPGTPGPCRRP